MAGFGEYKIVKTRKEHQCVCCNRRIPKGKKAHHFNGMWENDWQNWYMCDFCEEKDVYESDECFSGDEFYMWAQEILLCPNCQNWQKEWEWTDDNENLECLCTNCGYEWRQHIGWGKINKEVQDEQE